MLSACSSNEPEQVLQEITSPVDCISNVGWSWNDGVAEAEGSSYTIDNQIFSFLIKASGKMSFSYKLYDGRIVMKIDDFDAFDVKNSYYVYQSFSLAVKKGQKVTIKGYDSVIKDIKITGVSDNTNNPENPNNPWDF